MKARSLKIAAILFALVAAFPAAAQFNDVRRAVDREIGGNRIWIPFKGLARIFVKATHPEGVHDVQFAVYEGARKADRGRIEEIFRRELGPEWSPFVRVQSHREGDSAVMFARDGGSGTIDLMIFAGDAEETVLMYTTIDVERFVAGMSEPEGFAAR